MNHIKTIILHPIALDILIHPLLIKAGAGVKEIQERLGHSDINTTMNIYAHMTKNIEEKTSHKFSELTKGLL